MVSAKVPNRGARFIPDIALFVPKMLWKALNPLARDSSGPNSRSHSITGLLQGKRPGAGSSWLNSPCQASVHGTMIIASAVSRYRSPNGARISDTEQVSTTMHLIRVDGLQIPAKTADTARTRNAALDPKPIFICKYLILLCFLVSPMGFEPMTY